MRDFRERFTRRGYLFSSRDGEFLRASWEARLVADYGREGVKPKTALKSLQEAERFYTRIEEVISNG
jgi:uncharacterized protein (UPF0332 family)